MGPFGSPLLPAMTSMESDGVYSVSFSFVLFWLISHRWAESDLFLTWWKVGYASSVVYMYIYLFFPIYDSMVDNNIQYL